MTVLEAAIKQLSDRIRALRAAGVEEDTGGVTLQNEVAPMLFSGLPVDAVALSYALDRRVDQAVAAAGAGIALGDVVKGALGEAVLLGYYIARAEAG